MGVAEGVEEFGASARCLPADTLVLFKDDGGKRWGPRREVGVLGKFRDADAAPLPASTELHRDSSRPIGSDVALDRLLDLGHAVC